jgi:hypothetical protein
MNPYLAILTLLLLAGTTQAMNQSETAYYDGIQTGYSLGYAALAGQTDHAKELEYNSMVAKLNSWLASVGHPDQWANLQKNAPYVLPPIFADFNRPLLIVNETTNANVEHKIDGAAKGTKADYTTNDMNLLPETVINQTDKAGNFKPYQGDYLGGV